MRYLLNKLIQAALTVFLVSLAIFLLFQIIPGDPVLSRIGDASDPVLEQTLRAQFELDKPAHQRYISWVGGVLRGDLGTSIRYDMPVSALMLERLGSTVALSAMALVLILLLGLPLGMVLARFSGGACGVALSVFTQLWISVPSFFLAILLMMLFSLKLGWFDVMGYLPPEMGILPFLKGLFLPALAVAAASMATLARYTRSAVLEQMGADYVRTARGKGLSSRVILCRHLLRNAFIPILTVLGIIITNVLSGAIVIESAFAIPGLGSLLHTGIKNRDLPLVQGISLYVSVMVVAMFFLIDVLYRLIDPRLESGGGGGR